jgi:hypothetical protein
MKAAVGTDKKYASIVSEIDRKFDVSDVKDSEGVTIKYLSYHFKGFPAVSIASLLGKMMLKKQNLMYTLH